MVKINKVVRKVTNFLKRGICIILIAVTMSTSFASTYFGAQEVCAAASVTALEGFIESLLTSLGYSCRSKADLSSITDGFKNQWERFKEDGLFEGTRFNALSTVAVGIDWLVNGSKFVCDTPVKIAIRDFALDYLSKRVATSRGQTTAAQDSIESYPETGGISEFRFGRLSEKGLRSLWNNLPVKCSGEVVNSFSSKIFTYGACALTTVVSSNGVKTWYLIFPAHQIGGKSSYLQYSDDVLSVRDSITGEPFSALDAWYSMKFTKESASADYVALSGSTVSIASLKDGSYYVNIQGKSYPFSYFQNKETFEDGIDIIYTSVGVYSSFKHFVAENDSVTSYPAADFVGDGSTAKDTSDNVVIGDGTSTEAIQSAVEQAIENNPSITQEEIDAIVNSIISELTGIEDSIDDGTEAQETANSWLSKIHTKVSSALDVNLSSIANKITAVNTSVSAKLGDVVTAIDGVASSVTSPIVKSLDDVISAIKGIDLSVDLASVLTRQNAANTYLSSLVDGSSALKEDVEDIAEQFTVIEGSGGQEDPDEDPNEDVGVWIPIIPTVLAFLKPVLEFFGNPLSIITRHLNDLKSTLKDIHIGWQEWIKGTYDNVTGIFKNQIPQIIHYLQQLLDNALLLPEAVALALSEMLADTIGNIEVPPIEIPEIEVPEVTVPDVQVNFPPIPDYMEILQQILAAIQSIFALNMPAIQAASLGLSNSLDGVFPDLPDLKKLFDEFHFTDDYDYPVIKITTPDIIKKAGFKNDYIVLIDCADYATYFVWARRLVRCFIWVCFVYSIFGHFKVRLAVD